MFRKEPESISIAPNANSKSIETVIGEGSLFEGTITARSALRVDGAVTGEIKSAGNVIIGASGEVQGTITANQLYIAGTIYGNITVTERTEFVSGGYLKGDITTGDLIVEKGAAFEGNCKMKATENRARTQRTGDNGSAKQTERPSGAEAKKS